MSDSAVIGATQPLPEQLPDLMRGWRSVPITLQDWESANITGSAAVSSLAYLLKINTGTTSNSGAAAYRRLRGMNPGGNATTTDWTKRLCVIVEMCRSGNDAASVHRFHLRAETALSDMTTDGFGVKILKDALWGESCGASQALINLNYQMVTNTVERIAMVLDPGVSVSWYVNGVLVGKQTDTTKVPATSQTLNLTMSSINGPASSVDCLSQCMFVQLLQEPSNG